MLRMTSSRVAARSTSSASHDAQQAVPADKFALRANLRLNCGVRAHMTKLENLQRMFGDIRAKTEWNIDGPMLWGYFFVDPSKEKLEKVVPLLEAQGYRFVNLYVPDLDEDEDEYFFLHMEREETHSIESLHERNQQLTAFTELHHIQSYDGMDVGPINEP